MIVKNFSRKEMERLNAIIAMDIMVRNMNNESAYFTWIYNTSAVTASYFHINNSFPHLYHILPKLKSNFNKWCYTPYYIAPLSFKNFLYISSILLKSSGCKFPILNIKLSFVSSVTFDTLAVDASLKLASSQ